LNLEMEKNVTLNHQDWVIGEQLNLP
jgi:hypothetical protein